MTAPIYNFPSSYQLQKIEQVKLPSRTADSFLFEIMPFDSADENLLIWEQDDVYKGFQQWRGLNAKPPSVGRIGSKRYFAEPGCYGEFIALREDELTKRRAMSPMAGPGGPINVADLVAQAHEQLLDRRLTLVKKIVADLLFTGSFTVAGVDGTTVYQGSYTQQAFTPSVPWSTVATATPLKDMRTYRLYEYGQSVTFGNAGGNFQVMSIATVNYLLGNTNSADLGGKRVEGGNTLNTLADLNKILVANDIMPIRIDSSGYFNSSGTFVRFVPDGKVLVAGHRTSGVRCGYYRYTRNVNAANAAPAPYVEVWVDPRIPKSVEVHDGHNGGPVLQYPGALLLVNAY